MSPQNYGSLSIGGMWVEAQNYSILDEGEHVCA